MPKSSNLRKDKAPKAPKAPITKKTEATTPPPVPELNNPKAPIPAAPAPAEKTVPKHSNAVPPVMEIPEPSVDEMLATKNGRTESKIPNGDTQIIDLREIGLGSLPYTFNTRAKRCDGDTIRSCFSEEYKLSNEDDFPDNGVVIDIGGFIGGYTCWAQHKWGSKGCKVLTVEPLPENIGFISQNIERNGWASRVHVIQGAAGFAEQPEGVPNGMVRIYYPDPAKANEESIFNHQFIGSAANLELARDYFVDVPRISLKYLLSQAKEKFGQDTIYCLKMDCEGGEYDFMDAADPEDLKKVKWIIGEYHGTKNQKTDEELVAKVKPLGFEILTPPHCADHGTIGLFLYRNTNL